LLPFQIFTDGLFIITPIVCCPSHFYNVKYVPPKRLSNGSGKPRVRVRQPRPRLRDRSRQADRGGALQRPLVLRRTPRITPVQAVLRYRDLLQVEDLFAPRRSSGHTRFITPQIRHQRPYVLLVPRPDAALRRRDIPTSQTARSNRPMSPNSSYRFCGCPLPPTSKVTDIVLRLMQKM
jgi:hypothetical protein